MPKVTKKNATTALTRTAGNISAAARALGVTGATLRFFLKKHPDIQEIVEEQREAVADYAESMLYKAVKLGEPWAIRLALVNNSRGRARGYLPNASVESMENAKLGDSFDWVAHYADFMRYRESHGREPNVIDGTEGD